MAIDSKQLRELVIRPALEYLDMWSESAEELLMGTAAQESHMGTYLKQLGGGPALGIFQMELATHDDIWANYLRYNNPLTEKIYKIVNKYPVNSRSDAHDLIINLEYAAIMCRLHYRRVAEALPAADDIGGLAMYWKKYYNTPLGRGTEHEFVANYERYVI